MFPPVSLLGPSTLAARELGLATGRRRERGRGSGRLSQHRLPSAPPVRLSLTRPAHRLRLSELMRQTPELADYAFVGFTRCGRFLLAYRTFHGAESPLSFAGHAEQYALQLWEWSCEAREDDSHSYRLAATRRQPFYLGGEVSDQLLLCFAQWPGDDRFVVVGGTKASTSVSTSRRLGRRDPSDSRLSAADLFDAVDAAVEHSVCVMRVPSADGQTPWAIVDCSYRTVDHVSLLDLPSAMLAKGWLFLPTGEGVIALLVDEGSRAVEEFARSRDSALTHVELDIKWRKGLHSTHSGDAKLEFSDGTVVGDVQVSLHSAQQMLNGHVESTKYFRVGYSTLKVERVIDWLLALGGPADSDGADSGTSTTPPPLDVADCAASLDELVSELAGIRGVCSYAVTVLGLGADDRELLVQLALLLERRCLPVHAQCELVLGWRFAEGPLRLVHVGALKTIVAETSARRVEEEKDGWTSNAETETENEEDAGSTRPILSASTDSGEENETWLERFARNKAAELERWRRREETLLATNLPVLRERSLLSLMDGNGSVELLLE